MALSLQKGSTLNLTKKEPSLKKILIGLGWELRPNMPMDLDASAFMLGPNGKLPQDEFLLFYNNLQSPDGALRHTGDNRTGLGDDDDEMILANLDLVSPAIEDIRIVVTIHDAATRRHNFGLLSDAYIRLFNVETKTEILRYDLDASFGAYTDVEFGRLSRQQGDWIFTASGIGANHGLQGYVDIYL